MLASFGGLSPDFPATTTGSHVTTALVVLLFFVGLLLALGACECYCVMLAYYTANRQNSNCRSAATSSTIGGSPKSSANFALFFITFGLVALFSVALPNGNVFESDAAFDPTTGWPAADAASAGGRCAHPLREWQRHSRAGRGRGPLAANATQLMMAQTEEDDDADESPAETIAPFDEWTEAQMKKQHEQRQQHHQQQQQQHQQQQQQQQQQHQQQQQQPPAVNGNGQQKGSSSSDHPPGPPQMVRPPLESADFNQPTPGLTGGPLDQVTVTSVVPEPPSTAGDASNQGLNPQAIVLPLPIEPPQRNYAAKECGAKVVQAHDEAEHRASILKEKERDEYMRTVCRTSGAHFVVVELCETIQVTRVEIANFELFSSSPRLLRVTGTERYPTSEWLHITNITADDSRHIQSFPIAKGPYAKFIKVELLEYYGAEHYCTLSLLRVFGVSIGDAMEYEADLHDHMNNNNDYVPPAAVATEAPPQAAEVAEPKNQTAPSASSAGSSAEKNSAEKSTQTEKSNEKSTQTQTSPNLVVKVKEVVKGIVTKAAHLVVPAAGTGSSVVLNRSNVSGGPDFAAGPGCQLPARNGLFRNRLSICHTCPIAPTQYCTRFCRAFSPNFVCAAGLQGWPKNASDASRVYTPVKPVASIEKDTQTLRDHSYDQQVPLDPIVPEPLELEPPVEPWVHVPPSKSPITVDVSMEVDVTPAAVCIRLNGQQAFIFLLGRIMREAELEAISTPVKPVIAEVVAELPKPPNGGRPVFKIEPKNGEHSPNSATPSNGGNGGGGGPQSPQDISLPGSALSHKESVFLRLNNRVKALELNISLSGQYLSELSRKYRNHTEQLQRQYNRTVKQLNETNHRLNDFSQTQLTKLDALRATVDELRTELQQLAEAQTMDSVDEIQYFVISACLLQSFVTFVVWLLCCRSSSSRQSHLQTVDVDRLLEKHLKELAQTNQRHIDMQLRAQLEHIEQRLANQQRQDDVWHRELNQNNDPLLDSDSAIDVQCDRLTQTAPASRTSSPCDLTITLSTNDHNIVSPAGGPDEDNNKENTDDHVLRPSVGNQPRNMTPVKQSTAAGELSTSSPDLSSTSTICGYKSTSTICGYQQPQQKRKSPGWQPVAGQKKRPAAGAGLKFRGSKKLLSTTQNTTSTISSATVVNNNRFASLLSSNAGRK